MSDEEKNTVSRKLKIGAAGTDPSNLAVNFGNLQSLINVGKSLYPARQEDPKDDWLTAFNFFANMAAPLVQYDSSVEL